MKPCELNYCQALPCLTSLVFFVKGGESDAGNRGSRGSCLTARQNTSFFCRPPVVLSKDTHQDLFAIQICSKLHPSQTASCGDMSLNLEIICCVPHLICTVIDHSSLCLYYLFIFSFFLVSPGFLGRRSRNLKCNVPTWYMAKSVSRKADAK